MLKGNMPSMAVQNGLQLSEMQEDAHLTELENNLIAQMINFQYIYQLPKSRWGATRKQMISVPVGQDTVLETVSQLPRLPKDAGLVPVNLKRKQEYENCHKKELIDPEKILRVLQILKTSGHPYYQFCDDLNLDSYKERCKEQDAQGYGLLFDVDGNLSKDSEEISNHEQVQNKATEEEEMEMRNLSSEENIVDESSRQKNETIPGNINLEDHGEGETVKIIGYKSKDEIPTIDIIKEGNTCIRVTFVDSDGEDEVTGAPKGSKKEDIIDEAIFWLNNMCIHTSDEFLTTNKK